MGGMKTTIHDGAVSQQTLKYVGHCLYRSSETQIYYAILKRAGKQIKRSLKTTDPALAKRRLAEFQEKAARLSGGENARIDFAALAERWLQIAGTALKPSARLRLVTAVNSLNKYFGIILVRGLTRAHAERWALVRSQQAAARTFNMELQVLARILEYAIREGLVLDNPARVIKRLKAPKDQIIIPTRAQFKLLLENIRQQGPLAKDGADLCEFLAYSGCRRGEATAMLWGDVDFDKKTFLVTGGETGTKNHEVRIVPLFPALENFLKNLLAGMPEKPKPSDNILKIKDAKTTLIKSSQRAGLPHFTHHSLRHFFCSNAIEAGVDFKAIAGWLGHKDGGLLVARTYGHLRDEHSTAMAQRMTFDAMG